MCEIDGKFQQFKSNKKDDGHFRISKRMLKKERRIFEYLREVFRNMLKDHIWFTFLVSSNSIMFKFDQRLVYMYQCMYLTVPTEKITR